MSVIKKESANNQLVCASILSATIERFRTGKPKDRSELDRVYAITITELEKIQAYFEKYSGMEGKIREAYFESIQIGLELPEEDNQLIEALQESIKYQNDKLGDLAKRKAKLSGALDGMNHSIKIDLEKIEQEIKNRMHTLEDLEKRLEDYQDPPEEESLIITEGEIRQAIEDYKDEEEF